MSAETDRIIAAIDAAIERKIIVARLTTDYQAKYSALAEANGMKAARDIVLRVSQQDTTSRRAPSITPEQAEALARLVQRIASWNNARWVQHLRSDVGDENADAIIAWVHHNIGPVSVGS